MRAESERARFFGGDDTRSSGDGNFHCILLVCEDDPPEYVAKLEEVNHNLITRTISAGGSCTGEHGIGVGKKQYLEKQFGAGAVGMMMRTLKLAMDPLNILNPGKLVDRAEKLRVRL